MRFATTICSATLLLLATASLSQAWVSPSSSSSFARPRPAALTLDSARRTVRNSRRALDASTNSLEEAVSPSSGGTANNVVLTVSDHPDAFDSFKLGSPRVHRYAPRSSGVLGVDERTEYVMWYHGRSQTMNTHNKTLPPLSTGRIGRATSRNGLIWTKAAQGSVSEDAPDVSLGLNTESWWGFDVAHVGLGNVLLPMSTPAMMTEGGVYLMYYHGGTFEETPLADYLEHDLPEDLQDATMQGMKMRIGVAVSQDGITWGRVEGDDPTGACIVPYDLQDVNSVEHVAPAQRAAMQQELYCAWPEVVVDAKKKQDEAFCMYYSCMLKDSKEKSIAYATSPDGFRWTKQGVCLRPGEDAPEMNDAGGVARCCVVKDALYDEAKDAWKELATWKMYYEGICSQDKKHRIYVAESRDGKTWTKQGLALDIGLAGMFDHDGVGTPHVVRMDDGSERMYYTGQGQDGSTAIGVARLTHGPTGWVREQATFNL